MHINYYSFLFFLFPCLCFTQIKVEKLDTLINSPYTDEISPVIGRNGKNLYFTRSKDPLFDKTLYINNVDVSVSSDFESYDSRLKGIYSYLQGEPVKDVVSSSFNQDIWIARGTFPGIFTHIEHPNYPLNNALPNSVCDINQRTNDLYIINQFGEEGSLSNGFSIAYYENGKYSFPKNIKFKGGFELRGDINLGVSSDGSILLISAKKGTDSEIYIAHRINYLTWSQPVKLSADVNTAFRESSPHLAYKDQALFYSSDYNSTSSDIYYNLKLNDSWTLWSEKFKLPYPINSDANEGGPYYYGGYLYFASDRDGTWDIFRAKFDPVEYAKKVIYNTSDPEIEPEVVETNKFETLDIRLYDIYTKEPLKGQLTILTPDQSLNKKYDIHFQGKNIPINVNYLDESTFVLSSRRYISESFPIREIPSNNKMDFYLYPDSVGINMAIEPILFKRSRSMVLSSSFEQLDRIAHILNDNPELKVLIRGHTDNVGSEEAKMKLSTERALGVKNYLVGAGVAEGRIKYEGVSDKEPLIGNSSEKTKSRNRRVEILISN